MMSKGEKFADALLKPVNKAAIVLLGFYTVLWGLWVANPFWDAFASAAIFSKLGLLAPEVFWGCLAIFCGLVTIRGAWRRSYRALVIGAGTAGWHWFMISIFYFLGDWTNTGGITSLTFAIYAAFIYLNIRVNHRAAHRNMNDMVQ
jgi:hypothetical protein